MTSLPDMWTDVYDWTCEHTFPFFKSSQLEGLCVGDLLSKLVYNQMYTHICVNTSDTGKLRKIGGLYQVHLLLMILMIVLWDVSIRGNWEMCTRDSSMSYNCMWICRYSINIIFKKNHLSDKISHAARLNCTNLKKSQKVFVTFCRSNI